MGVQSVETNDQNQLQIGKDIDKILDISLAERLKNKTTFYSYLNKKRKNYNESFLTNNHGGKNLLLIK